MKEEPGRKAAGNLDRTVFGFFNSFVDKDDDARVRGACDLIEYLSQTNVPKQNGKEGTANGTTPKTIAYALKRLVRGVGSTSNASRAGFYTGLAGLLSQLKGKEDICPSVTELFALVKSELSDSEKRTNDEENEKIRLELRVGKVLVCGAIIKAGLIDSATDEELETIFKALKKGLYKQVTPLVYTFLNELVPQIDGKRFKLFWPQFETVLNVPKEQHTIDSTFFLLLLSTGAHHKLVNKKYFERNFGAPKLLHPDAFPHLSGLLFNISSLMGINHPFYDCLLEQLIKAGLLVQFVAEAIGPILEQDQESRPKYRDIIVLRMFISCLGRLDDYSCVPELLHPSLVKFLLQNLKNLSDYSEDVRELHHEACKALMECYPKIVEEKDRLATYRRLTQAPSSILIEKYASSKLLQNLLATLSTESLKSIGTELKALILDESVTVTNSERSYAAQMLQRLYSLRQFTSDTKDKHQADEQRLEVVRFFLTLGVFYSSDGVKVLKSSKHDGAISQELATTLRGLFFHSLDHRHAELSHERDFLLAIVHHVHETLQAHGGVKSLRAPLTEEQMSCWNRMYASVVVAGEGGPKESKKRSTTKDGKKLDTVFHILLMHMGLHLFSDPELAASSIAELESVMKRVGGKGKKKRRQSGANGVSDNEDEEPEWIEVVVDLFLNLLSQNSHLLRNVINHVFPHLSAELTLTAFNQIMSVINLKDKTNPLSAENEEADDEMDGAEEEEEEEQESDNEGSKATKKVKKNKADEDDDDEDDDDEEDDEDDDDEELMGDEEEEETISDKMRQAVQLALGGANPDTDTESVDLDEMDEEQGRKLDAALSDAFRAFRQAKSNNRKKGPTQAEQQMDTVLTHFRMRVFDLIDAYLKHEPDMILCLELMLYVFEMLPIAMREGSKYGAILNRYKQIFNTLVRIKEFRRNAQDVGAEQLNQILRDLIDKVAKGVPFPERNTYLLKACQFIVICSQMLESNDREQKQNGSEKLQVDKIFGDLLADILTNRNPPIALNMFQTIFRMPWSGNWHLAVRVATGGLKVGPIRGIRRIQVLQLVRELLRNRRFVSLDQPLAKQSLATICTDAVAPYVAELKVAVSGGDRSIGQNELFELLQLLLEIHRLQPQPDADGGAVVSKKLQKQQKSHRLLNWETIGQHVQAMRRFALSSQTMSCYRQLCNRLGLTPIGNGDILAVKANGDSSTRTPDIPTMNGVSEKQKKKKKGVEKGQKQTEDESIQLNGHAMNGHDDEDDNGDIEKEVNGDEAPVNGLKRKRSKASQATHNGNGEPASDNSKKEKRRKKEARLQSASLGLEGVSFA